MANVKFDGIGEELVTFKHSTLTEGTHENYPVAVSANDTVSAPSDGDVFEGVVQMIDDNNNVCSVQIKGFVTIDYTGTAPTVGWDTLVSNGAGGVKIASDAVGKPMYRVVNVNTTAETVTFDLG